MRKSMSNLFKKAPPTVGIILRGGYNRLSNPALFL
jgi:hypothetical protein